LAVPASAVLFLEGIELGMYGVDNLSPGGAMVTGDVAAARGERLTAMLLFTNRPPIEVDAHVTRLDRSVGSLVRMGLRFDHWSAATEDALRDALYGSTSIRPDRIELDEMWDDPDLVPIVPEPR
jgi:hypothetical protein